MTSATSEKANVYSGLQLRTLPPRPPRHPLVRAQMSLDDERLRDSPIILVQAPPGFGKTSLLGQWRREHLARGAAVAWIGADEQDDLPRFIHGLTLAVQAGCARPNFGAQLLGAGGTSIGEREGITTWLAEVAQAALDLVLIIDEAERLSPANLDALTYLLHNTPPNLRIIVAGRGGLEAAVSDLTAYGQCIVVGPDQLRFRLDETVALMRSRFGSKVDMDACARLHEMTEGWPLGLQLSMSALQQGGDLRAAVDTLAAQSAEERQQLMSGLLQKLRPDDVDFLTRIALVDTIHPDLCRALTLRDDAPEHLARLGLDTPIFIAADNSEWSRLHSLARDVFRARLSALPAEVRRELHARAMQWFSARGMVREAAEHAHLGGLGELAYDLAEQCLYDTVTQGNQGAVLEWLERLPPAELDRRPRLKLAVAWALALSERHDEARRLVEQILASATEPVLRYECALIAGGAAYYGDHPDQCLELFAPWSEAPPSREPRLLRMHANRLAALALLKGDPVLARRQLQLAPRETEDKAQGYGARWGALIGGLSYLWEGKILLGEQVLQPALASCDAGLGRRHPLSCMMAALLAAAAYERDHIDDAATLLANRLDVLERIGTPEITLFGYRTAARIAAAQGFEHKALDLLDTLYAIGISRQLPRICVGALTEQVRMHAARARIETCNVLVHQIDEIIEANTASRGPLWRRATEWLQALAHCYTAIAAHDWERTLQALDDASAAAGSLGLGRVGVEVMALRALALERKGLDGKPLLREAINLAQSQGLVRTFADADPALADWARRVAEDDGKAPGAGDGVAVARIVRPPREPAAGAPRAVPSMVLTPKERSVLELLARNLSNKEIAQAMSVGEETVKWHLKNLFGKLGAGTRKHVVRRAQLLGLLEETE